MEKKFLNIFNEINGTKKNVVKSFFIQYQSLIERANKIYGLRSKSITIKLNPTPNIASKT